MILFGPFRLGHWRVGTQQIIKPKPGPPGNRPPTFDAYQPRDLVIARKDAISSECSKKRLSRKPARRESNSILEDSWSRGGSVVVILERGNLRLGIGWHQTI